MWGSGFRWLPQEDRRKLYDWSNAMMFYDDPEMAGAQMDAFAEILGYAMAKADERRQDPKDDIITKLISADVDGRGLTDDEFGFFVILLVVASNETTRNAITWGMHAFLENPDQWELFKRERPKTAVDEIIRWATPVTVFQRTAVNDVEVGGVQVAKGERVACSTPAPTSTRTSSTTRSRSTSFGTPTPTRPSGATAALLHRRQPGAPRGRPDLQRHRRPGSGHPDAGRPAAAAERMDQRRQGPPGRLPLNDPQTAERPTT